MSNTPNNIPPEKRKGTFRWDTKYLYWGITATSVLVVTLLCYTLFTQWQSGLHYIQVALNVLSPILIGLVIAYLLLRPAKFFERVVLKRVGSKRKPETGRKIRRALSILIVAVIGLAFVVGVLWLILPRVYESLQSLLSNLPGYFRVALGWVTQIIEDNEEIGNYIVNATTNLSEFITNFIQERVIGRIDTILISLTTGVFGVLRGLINVLIGIVVAVYVLYNREAFSGHMKKGLYAVAKPRRAEQTMRMMRFIDKTCGNYIIAQLIDALIFGVVCYIVFSIFRMPYALLMAVVVGVTNVIPFFGPFIGGIPCGLLLLLESPTKCWIFVIAIVILQQLDGNVLNPRIQGSSIGLSGFWIVFAVTVAGGLFGFPGFVLGVPVFAVIYKVLGELVSRRLKKRGLPPESEAYEQSGALDIADTGQNGAPPVGEDGEVPPVE
ncbi:MAG: AI-2E family transporter [Oscillospiraceae bacterium]|jgi:predicted PurR-regulated permease PerM|nr:AI-2E family transporter [Oscillospiraceae bacterium]